MIDNDNYNKHQINIKLMIIKQTQNPIERKYRETIAGYCGHEATMKETLERLDAIREMIRTYIENENKLQTKRTTQVGFDLS